MTKAAYPKVSHLPEKSPIRKKVVHYLQDQERVALAVYKAVYALYGVEMLDWEPETLWLQLEKDGVELSVQERNKLQAARTLKKNAASLWDNQVFQYIVQALNGVPFDPDTLQECIPAHMAWAVVESAAIFAAEEGERDTEGEEAPEYDEDVQSYVAVCLKRAGMVYPPDPLVFAEDALARLQTKDEKKLAVTVKQAWEAVRQLIDVQNVEFSEQEDQVQLAKLAACRIYVNKKEADTLRDVGQLLDFWI